MRRTVTRRQLLRRIFGGIALAGGGTAAYAAAAEPLLPRREEVTIALLGLPLAFDGMTIALLSDLHIQPGFPASRLRSVVSLTNEARPDLILLGGDYINDRAPKRERYMEECAAALTGLRAESGVFAVFGNHDYPEPPNDPPAAPWRDAGITPLNNEVVPVNRRGSSDVLYLVGMRSAVSRPAAPGEVMRGTPPDAPRIVLWHEPDRAEESARAGASLQLSGHTHGGQVRLPFAGPLALPALGRKYPAGLYEVEKMPLYVTRGIGLLPPLVRFNCPPEVTLLTLRRRPA